METAMRAATVRAAMEKAAMEKAAMEKAETAPGAQRSFSYQATSQ
jgi:hypothetical protein